MMVLMMVDFMENPNQTWMSQSLLMGVSSSSWGYLKMSLVGLFQGKSIYEFQMNFIKSTISNSKNSDENWGYPRDEKGPPPFSDGAAPLAHDSARTTNWERAPPGRSGPQSSDANNTMN